MDLPCELLRPSEPVGAMLVAPAAEESVGVDAADFLRIFAGWDATRAAIAVVDTRAAADFSASHLKGACNLITAPLMLRRLQQGKVSLHRAVHGDLPGPPDPSTPFYVLGYNGSSSSGSSSDDGDNSKANDADRLAQHAVALWCASVGSPCIIVRGGFARVARLLGRAHPLLATSSPCLRPAHVGASDGSSSMASSKRSTPPVHGRKRPFSMGELQLKLPSSEAASVPPPGRHCCPRPGPVKELSCILPNQLFVGCIHDASDQALLRHHGITYVALEPPPLLPLLPSFLPLASRLCRCCMCPMRAAGMW
jgi:hypothetical protein